MDPFLTFYERVVGLWVFSFDESEIRARFHRKVLRKDFFTMIIFRKNVHADLFGYLDVNFIVSIFDTNNINKLSYNVFNKNLRNSQIEKHFWGSVRY